MKNLTFSTLLFPLLILLVIAGLFFIALTQALIIPTFHMDGAFQTASGLARLSEGQIPGRDFFPYLGLGPLFLLFPAFFASGAQLASSVFAAKFITLLSAFFIFSTLFKIVFYNRKWLEAFLGGAVLLLITNGLIFLGAIEKFSFLFEPGNSLRPLRALLPYIAVVLLMLFIRLFKEGKIYLAAGVYIFACTVSLFWSNDYGLPTFLMLNFSSLVFLSVYRKNLGTNYGLKLLFYFASCTALALLFYGALLFALMGLGFVEFLRYNFVDVAADQWWYFGSYIPKNRIFFLLDVFRIFKPNMMFYPLCTLVLLAVLLFIRQLKTQRRTVKGKLISLTFHEKKSSGSAAIESYLFLAFIGLVTFGGGLLASVGGHFQKGYFFSFYIWGVTALALLLVKFLWSNFSQNLLEKYNTKNTKRTAIALLVGVCSAFSLHHATSFYQHKNALKQAEDYFFVEELGGYLNKVWQPYVQLARESKDLVVYEEYWGIFSAIAGKHPAWKVDSIIHALGKQRQTSDALLASADVIITTREDFGDARWLGWNLGQNWWFYDDLFKSDWQQAYVSPTTILWRRTQNKPDDAQETSAEKKTFKCQINSGGTSYSIPSGKKGLYELVLDYEVELAKSAIPRLRTLAFAENGLSFSNVLYGMVSINPAETRAIFPVYVTNPKQHFKVRALPEGSAVRLKGCSAVFLKSPEFYGQAIADGFKPLNSLWRIYLLRDHSRMFPEN